MKIKVLVVDDSLLFRNLLQMLLKNNNEIEVVEAQDAFEAREKLMIQTRCYDVRSFNALYGWAWSFLKKLWSTFLQNNCNFITTPEAQETFRAIELGALEIIENHIALIGILFY